MGRLGPEILRHILVSSRIHGRSIPELSMTFRSDHAVRTDHAGFAGLLSIALNKCLWRSFVQILRAMFELIIIVSGCSLFLRLPLQNRTVPLLFITIATIGLVTKERLPALYIRLDAAPGMADFGNQFCSVEPRKILPRWNSCFRPGKKPGRGGR